MQEKSTSESTKVYQSMESAIANIKNHKLGDVCRVLEENFQFYLLVDDLDGNKFWHPFDGVHLEEALNVNKTFKAGQKKYREHPLTSEDVEAMRNIMTAVATLSVLFEYTDDEIVQLTDNAIVKFAFDLYKRDLKKPKELKLTDMSPEDQELAAYVTKVTFVFEEYRDIISKVQASVEEAKTDANKVKEDTDEHSVN